MRRLKTRLAVLFALVLLAGVGIAPSADASVSSSLSSSPAGGTYSYSISKASADLASVSGTLKDTRADGYCAYARVSIAITLSADIAQERTVCGSGSSVKVFTAATAPGGLFIITGIKFKVCRKKGSTLSGCSYRTFDAV